MKKLDWHYVNKDEIKDNVDKIVLEAINEAMQEESCLDDTQFIAVMNAIMSLRNAIVGNIDMPAEETAEAGKDEGNG